jgi:hypothetical protein
MVVRRRSRILIAFLTVAVFAIGPRRSVDGAPTGSAARLLPDW